MVSNGFTENDNSAARASARDAWVGSTRGYFVEACSALRTHPEYAMLQIRHISEGLVHIVCVVEKQGFQPYNGSALNRLPMAKALTEAAQHLPPDRLDLINGLKKLGNIYLHNQGEVQRSSPRMAQAALLQCAELLTWVDRDILGEEQPPEVAQAMRSLEGAPLEPTPLAGSAATPIAGPPLPPQPPQPGVASGTSPQSRRGLLAGAVAVGLVLVAALIGWALLKTGGAPTSISPSAAAAPEVAWVAAYNAAIASRDVDRILAIHALPTQRFFMVTNQNEAQLRKLYEGWFRGSGKTRETGFRNCQPATVAADGSRALRCDTYVDPPFDKGLSVVAVCLVFRTDGRLTSRTELGAFPSCPPPPP